MPHFAPKAGSPWHNCLYCLRPECEAGDSPCVRCLPFMLIGVFCRVEEGFFARRPGTMTKVWCSTQRTLAGLAMEEAPERL